MTCTPYGINTHRLLVRGHRIENEAEAAVVRVPADAIQIEPAAVAPLVAVPLLLLLFAGLLLMTRRRRKPRDRSGRPAGGQRGKRGKQSRRDKKEKKQETVEGGIQNEDT